MRLPACGTLASGVAVGQAQPVAASTGKRQGFVAASHDSPDHPGRFRRSPSQLRSTMQSPPSARKRTQSASASARVCRPTWA